MAGGRKQVGLVAKSKKVTRGKFPTEGIKSIKIGSQRFVLESLQKEIIAKEKTKTFMDSITKTWERNREKSLTYTLEDALRSNKISMDAAFRNHQGELARSLFYGDFLAMHYPKYINHVPELLHLYLKNKIPLKFIYDLKSNAYSTYSKYRDNWEVMTGLHRSHYTSFLYQLIPENMKENIEHSDLSAKEKKKYIDELEKIAVKNSTALIEGIIKGINKSKSDREYSNTHRSSGRYPYIP